MYIVLRSLLRCLPDNKSYEDTSTFIFRVWVFAGYISLPITKYLSFTWLNFFEVGARLDPEHPLSF